MTDAGTGDAGTTTDAGAPPAGGTPPPETPPAGGDAGGGGSLSWVPEDLRGHAALKDAADPVEVARRLVKRDGDYEGVKSLIGKRVENLTPEEAQKLYETLGRPDSPDGYVIDTSKLPEGVDISEEFAASVRQTAFDKGLLPKQVDALSAIYLEAVTRQHAAQQEAVARLEDEAHSTLKREWGNRYDENIRLADRAIREFGGDALMAELKQVGALGANGEVRTPHLAKALAEIGGKAAGDGALVGGGKEGFGGEMSPDAASAAYAALKRDPNFMKALMDKNHPGHADAVAQRDRLFKDANPDI